MKGYRINWRVLITCAAIVTVLGFFSWVAAVGALGVIALLLAANGAWDHSIGQYGIGNDYVDSEPRSDERRD